VKGLALTVALLALPASAGAQMLTLNCQYESSSDPKTNIELPMSGAFSAIVHMKEPETEGGARIEATTSGCFNYVGVFNEQEVIVGCERVIGGTKFTDDLSINRINGEFSHVSVVNQGKPGASSMLYTGHCTPAKKLF
jgi:hypothetical protein